MLTTEKIEQQRRRLVIDFMEFLAGVWDEDDEEEKLYYDQVETLINDRFDILQAQLISNDK